MTSHKRRGERGPSSQEHCHTKAISFLHNISTQKNRKRKEKTHLIWMLLPRSLYIKSSLTPMWCTLWHCLGTELCHCRPEGHRGVAESPHWIWGWAWALTLPRDGIFASSHKHNHRAGDVALGRVCEQARPLAGQWEGLQHSEIGGQSEVWTALTFTDMCRANIISRTVDREEIVVCCVENYSPAFTDVVRLFQQTIGYTYICSDLILVTSSCLVFIGPLETM